MQTKTLRRYRERTENGKTDVWTRRALGDSVTRSPLSLSLSLLNSPPLISLSNIQIHAVLGRHSGSACANTMYSSVNNPCMLFCCFCGENSVLPKVTLVDTKVAAA
jgi:hypothetical protein